MRYVSIFSGIEAATVAWSRLGWEPLAFAEVDEFPSAVLAHRFPDVPNLGNSMTTDVIELLGRRIQAYDELHYDEVGLGGADL